MPKYPAIMPMAANQCPISTMHRLLAHHDHYHPIHHPQVEALPHVPGKTSSQVSSSNVTSSSKRIGSMTDCHGNDNGGMIDTSRYLRLRNIQVEQQVRGCQSRGLSSYDSFLAWMFIVVSFFKCFAPPSEETKQSYFCALAHFVRVERGRPLFLHKNYATLNEAVADLKQKQQAAEQGLSDDEVFPACMVQLLHELLPKYNDSMLEIAFTSNVHRFWFRLATVRLFVAALWLRAAPTTTHWFASHCPNLYWTWCCNSKNAVRKYDAQHNKRPHVSPWLDIRK